MGSAAFGQSAGPVSNEYVTVHSGTVEKVCDFPTLCRSFGI